MLTRIAAAQEILRMREKTIGAERGAMLPRRSIRAHA